MHSSELCFFIASFVLLARITLTSSSVISAFIYEGKKASSSRENSDAIRDAIASGSPCGMLLFLENCLLISRKRCSELSLKFIARVKNRQLPFEFSWCFSPLKERNISFFSIRSEISFAKEVSVPVKEIVNSKSQCCVCAFVLNPPIK